MSNNKAPKVSRFTTIASASAWIDNSRIGGNKIILGDDDKFWVADSAREQARLIEGGYETV